MLLDDTDYPKDWQIIHLDRVTKRGSGHTPSKSHPEYWNGNIKWVSLADSYRLDDGYISDTDKKISQEGIKNSSAVIHPPQTVILSRDAGVGKSAVTKEAMAVSQHFIAWNCNQVGKVAPWFLYYTLQFHQKELERQAVGSTIKTIGLPFFKNLEIALPPLPEQEKIAAILSTWDRAIEGTEKLLANSQQQKKALMQQLFTGKKRLPGFTGEWKTKYLGDIADIQTGSSNRQDSLTNGEYTFFDRSEDIRKSNRYLFDCEAVIVPGEGQDFVPKYFVGKFDLHQRTYAISCFRACDGKFIFYMVGYHRSHFLSQAVGSTVKSLRLPMFQKMPLKLPPLLEQRAVAAVLTTADEEITALKSDLSRLRAEKKALMQQLLTGKRRVTVD